MSEQNLDPELNAVAASLAHLRPRPVELDRDALMFRAGQAAARPGWFWPLATTLSTLTACALGAALLLRPQPPSSAPPVIVQVSVPVLAIQPESKPVVPNVDTPALVSHQADAPPVTEYQRLQDHLLRWGFDGLPTAPHNAPPPETPEKLLRSL